MNPLFLGTVSLLLIVIQTAVLPKLRIFGPGYDIFIVFIVYLCLTRPHLEAVLFSICGGLIMDAISGGPWGIFLTIYIWTNIFLKLGLRVLQLGSPFVISILVAIGVVLENLLIVTLFEGMDRNGLVYLNPSGLLVSQIFWAALTSPFVFWIILSCHRRFTKLVKARHRGAEAYSFRKTASGQSQRNL
jgi:rod shape-determining protein MreD